MYHGKYANVMDLRLIWLLISHLLHEVTWAGPVRDKTDAEAYLTQYHYMGDNNPSKEIGQLVDRAPHKAWTDALKLFQAFWHLPVSGKLDNATMNLMSKDRCGVPDINTIGDMSKRKKRYTLQGSRWYKTDITYKVDYYPKDFDLTAAQLNQVLERAFSVWQEVSSLNFIRKGPNDIVDIHISFRTYWHGDSYPFDGYGGTLAHAFFPGYGGDIHLDDNEIWTIRTKHGTNLFQVVVHEIGHSLGLGHSSNRNALMYPFYAGYTPDFSLHWDDIQAIQMIYGPPENVPPSFWTRPPATPDTGLAPHCMDIVFDAITNHFENKHANTYAFFGKYYTLIDNNGMVIGYPHLISSDWPGLPSDIDAALYWEATEEERVDFSNWKGFGWNRVVQVAPARTYFFKGEQYWRYENKRLIRGYPKKIADGFHGIPNNIDAAFVWSGNGMTYFIKGNQYYRYVRSVGVDYGYPQKLSIWRGLPARIDAAFKWEVNKQTYFFSGKDYYKFDDTSFKTFSSYPRSLSKWWLNCAKDQHSLVQPNGTEDPQDTVEAPSRATDVPPSFSDRLKPAYIMFILVLCFLAVF